MNDWPRQSSSRELPVFSFPQLVPSSRCLNCEVCCRFPEAESILRPYFFASEIQWAVEHGVDPSHFSDPQGSQISVVPDPSGEGFLCPAFDSQTSHCRIYERRPLDCRIYPFVLMWNELRQVVVLGWDLKCPFMLDEERCGHSGASLSPVRIHADRIRALLEGEMVSHIAAHPQFITPFQDDIVIVAELPGLTEHVFLNVQDVELFPHGDDDDASPIHIS